jgi:acetoin utilization deacetylase AcuC-like enzyme
MLKYELLPQQLVYEGTATEADFFAPDLPDMKHILAIHDKYYVDDLLDLTLDPRAVRKIGFPLSAELIERELRIAQGTMWMPSGNGKRDSIQYCGRHASRLQHTR